MGYTAELNEAGESPSVISRRQDDSTMDAVMSALEDGAILRIHMKVRRAAIEGLSEKDKRNGRTISFSRAKRLEKDGVIREIGIGKYAIATDSNLQP